MNINTNNSRQPNKKPAIIIASIIIVALLAVASVFAYQKLFPNAAVSNTPAIDKPATQEEIDTGTKIKESAVEKGNDHNQEPVESDLALTLNGPSQNNGMFQVRTIVTNNISSDGTCVITLKKENRVVTRSAAVQALPTTSTCAGFDIPVSDLEKGTWQISIVVNSDGKEGTINTSFEVL